MSDLNALTKKGAGAAPGVHTKPAALVIAVDFGTTYSGCSWALSANPDEIFTIKSWPSRDNGRFEKVPTEISYNNGFSMIDGTRVPFEWGFKSQRDSQRIQWVKLLLDPSQNSKIDGLRQFAERAQRLIPRGKTPCDVVTDYLTGLRAYIHKEICNKFGKDYLEVVPKEYVFTVPAIWSDKAKALTEKAAKAAGFISRDDELLVVPEPEAAALCCLKDVRPNSINVGDNFVVVDCGGGTVDLISYQILRLNPTMELCESAVGDGDLCGSVILNSLFEKHVRNRMGAKKFEALKPAARQHMESHFDEHIKRAFGDDDEDDIFTVAIPGVADDPESGIEGGFFVLTRDELREIFRPVIERIQNLVENQCQMIQRSGGKVSAILLVGGFGSSRYLLSHFQSWGIKNGGIMVLQPPNAWSCIARGAVMAGLQYDKDMIKSRLARHYYGISFQEPFVDGHHPAKHRVWNEERNEWYCSKRMKWFIHKGDKIQEDEPLDRIFTSDVFSEEFKRPANRKAHFVLYAFDGDNPPRFSDASGVYKVTQMTTDLSTIPSRAWEKRNYGGEQDTMTISYDVRMVLHGAMLNFEIRHKGKRYGYITIKFE